MCRHLSDDVGDNDEDQGLINLLSLGNIAISGSSSIVCLSIKRRQTQEKLEHESAVLLLQPKN